MKRITAILTVLMLLLGLLAGCQSAEATSVVVLEAATAVQLNLKGTTVDDAASELNGIKLDKAIASVIATMIEKGELTAESNTVLVTVSDAAQQQAAADAVSAAFEAQGFAGAAICQSAEDAAKGKAVLADRMAAALDGYSAEALEKLDITVLNLLCQTASGSVADVSFLGTASEEALVGADLALDVALAQAEVAADAATDIEVVLSFSDFLFYDVKFTADGTALEAYINATTGELLYSGIVGGERTDDDQDAYVSEETAIAAACISVGAEVAAVKDVQCKLVDASAQIFYDISFTYNGNKYNVMISAPTGQPLEGDVAVEEDNIIPEDTASLPADETTGITQDDTSVSGSVDEAVSSDENADLGG